MANFQSVLKFSNSSDIVEIPFTAPVKPSRFTISCWTRVLGGQGNWRVPVCLRDTTSSNRYAFYAGTGNQWHFYIEATSVDSIVGSTVTLNAWTHIAATYDSTKLRLYVNSNLVAQKDTVAPYTINRVEIGSVAGSYPFPGEVTEVCFWNRDRTQAEIQQDMYRGLRGDEPDLLGYWSLSEGSGNTVADKTERKNNGTIKGATWQQQIFLKSPEPSVNDFSSTLKFDGVDDHIVLPAMNIDYSRGITVEAWVRYNSFKTTSSIISLGSATPGSPNITLFTGGISNCHLGLSVFKDFKEKGVLMDGLLEIGRWTHLAATLDNAGKAKIYVNGNLVKEKDLCPPETVNRANNYLGKSSSSEQNYFDGQIAEVRLWNRPLSSQEIQQNLSRRLVGNEAGLVGYWPLNEGAGNTIVTDRSASANHGTINGATWEEPIFLQAASQQRPFQSVLALDGQDDCVEIPYTPTLNPNRFTASCWVKVQGGQGSNRCVIASSDSNPNKGYILYVANNNKWQFWIGDGKGSGIVVVGSDVTLDRWTHVAATCDGSKLALYINGELAKEGTVNYAPNTARPLRIGAGSTEGNPTMFLTGQIADASIWNRPLSQAEIQKQMDVRLVGNEPGLVGYWRLDESAGNIATDKSISANHGVIKGGATWNRQLFALKAETQAALVEGKVSLERNVALCFDGRDDCINLGKKTLFKVEKNLTLEAWVYTEKDNPNWAGIFSNVWDTGSTESGYCLCLDSKGGVELGLTPSSTNRIIYLSSGANTLPLNEWHHVAGVYDGQQMRVYIDGVQKITQAVASPSISYNPENNLHIGVYKDDDEAVYFKGKIADVRLWNVARSPEEIQKNMLCRLIGNEPGLVGYWPLNEGSGNTVSDKTVQGNNGPISGATWGEPGPKLAAAKVLEAKPVDANQEKALAELKAALEKALADKVAAEAKAAADAKAATDAKAAAEKATAEKQAAEKQAADAKAAADKVTTEKQAAEKQAADAKAAADKVTAEKQAAEKAAAAEKAVADKAAAEKAELEKALAEAKATADKAVAEAQAATATKLAAEAKAAADKAEAEAQIAEIKAATAKKVEKAEAEARAAEARAKAAEAAALALAAEEKAKEVKGETKDKVTGINADRAKSLLLNNSTGLEDYGYWWQQMLQQPKRESEGDRDNRRGRIWS